MSRTVWKTQVPIEGATVRVPVGATVASVGPDPSGALDVVAVWWIVDSSYPETTAVIAVTGTGQPVPAGFGASVGAKYLGVAICPPAVWHVWLTGMGE